MSTKTKTAGAAAARDKARAARAALIAERAEQEARVDDQVMSFYLAVEDQERARAALDRATEARRQAIAALVQLGETPATILRLCDGTTATEVRAATKPAPSPARREPAAPSQARHDGADDHQHP